MNDDGIANKYLDLINANPERASINITRMYSEIFNLPINSDLFRIFGKLCNIYGYKTVFYSILDATGLETLEPAKPYGIISYFCKKRLEGTISDPILDLTGYIEKQRRDLSKRKKIIARTLE